MSFAKETASLSVRQVTPATSHDLWQNHERRQVRLATSQVTHHGTRMWRIDSSGKLSTCLHHLPARVMNRCTRVITRSHQRKFISNLGMSWQDFGNLDLWRNCLDWLERPTDFCGGIRLQVKCIQVTGSTQIENHDTGPVIVLVLDGALRLGLHVLWQGQPNRSQRPDLEHIATRHPITCVSFSLTS